MEGAVKNVWPFLIWGSYSEIKIKEGAGGESGGKERKMGKKVVGRKREKWHVKYQRESYMFSFHILSWFDSGAVSQLRMCSAKSSKCLEMMGMEQGKELRKGEGQREWNTEGQNNCERWDEWGNWK